MPENTNETIAEQIKEAEDSEGAEKKHNQETEALVQNAGKAKLADLADKFIVIKATTDFGDLFADLGDMPLILAIKDNNVYKLHLAASKFADEVADPTKGDLVVELDTANKEIHWLQDHQEQQPFEAFNSLHSSKYVGDDAGQPLLDAIQDYIRGTFNISGYDSRLVSKAELVADLKSNGTSTTGGGSSTGTGTGTGNSGSTTTPAANGGVSPQSLEAFAVQAPKSNSNKSNSSNSNTKSTKASSNSSSSNPSSNSSNKNNSNSKSSK